MNYSNAFDKIKQFELVLAEYTGAPYTIMTDCCTHAIEMCLRHDNVREVRMTPRTYLSIPMTMHKLGIQYTYTGEEQWLGEYPFGLTRIWDSARRLEENMYRPGTMQCLSFGYDKPLQIGRGGAILLDDSSAYESLIRMRYDGRDLNTVPWTNQKEFKVGYHYKPRPEEAELGIALLQGIMESKPKPKYVEYADLRQFTIID